MKDTSQTTRKKDFIFMILYAIISEALEFYQQFLLLFIFRDPNFISTSILFQPSNIDIEVTETVSSLPQEEFSMGSLMGMASGGGGGVGGRSVGRSVSPDISPVQTGPLYGSGQAVFPVAHQQPSSSSGRSFESASSQDAGQPSAAKRPRIAMTSSTNDSNAAASSSSSSASALNSSSTALPSNSLLPSVASKVLNISNNNVASSPPIHRRKSPPRSVSFEITPSIDHLNNH